MKDQEREQTERERLINILKEFCTDVSKGPEGYADVILTEYVPASELKSAVEACEKAVNSIKKNLHGEWGLAEEIKVSITRAKKWIGGV